MTRAEAYPIITREVGRIIGDQARDDPAVSAYLIARSALLVVRGRHGPARAAAMAYKLADELATTP